MIRHTHSSSRSSRTHERIVLGLVLFLSLTGTASANAGTPLILSGLFHLLIGNLLIGFVEGFIIMSFFGRPEAKTLLAMILANYTSTWLAVSLGSISWINHYPLDLNNVRNLFLVMIVAAWAFTILVEWPFVRFCLRGKEHPWRKSLKASLVVQTLSYVIMVGWYWSVSGTSLLTGVQGVSPAELKLPDAVEVFYIGPADGDVYRRPLAGGTATKVFDLDSKTIGDMVFATPPINGHVDLHAALAKEERSVPVLAQFPASESTSQEQNIEGGTWFNFGRALKIGNPGDNWEFETGFWAVEGLDAKNLKTGEMVHLSMETPFCMWHARNAVHLPGDLVLFQLGENQICVFDPVTRRIALLWHGRGFVAVIPRK